MQLTSADIYFDHEVKTKDEALQHIVRCLTEAGHTTPAYLNGMRERERQISTYLGNGIAIPHGTPQSRDAVSKTGVKVLACPQGVDWGEEQTAYLIVGIAAQDNEHLDILRQLTHALSDERDLVRYRTPRARRRCWTFWRVIFCPSMGRTSHRPRSLTKRRRLPYATPTDCTPGQAPCWSKRLNSGNRKFGWKISTRVPRLSMPKT